MSLSGKRRRRKRRRRRRGPSGGGETINNQERYTIFPYFENVICLSNEK